MVDQKERMISHPLFLNHFASQFIELSLENTLATLK